MAGCGPEKPKSAAVIIDTTGDHLLEHLAKLGYKKAVLTGIRTEDCHDDNATIGYGIKVRVRDTIISGVMCQDTTNPGYWLVLDNKREEFSWEVIDEKLMGF